MADESENKATLDRIGAFFKAAPGAIYGAINAKELFRVAMTAALAGASINGIAHAIIDSSALVFTNPTVASIVSAIITAALAYAEGQRRLNQGQGGGGDPSP